MRWKPTRRLYWVGVVSLASVVAVACGDDNDEASSVERYCELAREHGEAGLEMFAEVEGDASATEEDFAEAERQFVEDHQDDFEELREAAPGEIADDVDVLLAFEEQRAAGGEQDFASELVAAQERVGAFEEANCGEYGDDGPAAAVWRTSAGWAAVAAQGETPPPVTEEPTSGSSTFTAHVTRLDCNSGVTGEVLAPEIAVSETEIVVTFSVEPLSDDEATCPMNDLVPYVVELGEPVGNRRLIDGACFPGGAAETTTLCENGGVRWEP